MVIRKEQHVYVAAANFLNDYFQQTVSLIPPETMRV